MKTLSRKRKTLIIISLLILVVILSVGYAVKASLAKSNFAVFRVTPFSVVADKINAAEKNGGSVELGSEDLNGIFDYFSRKGIKSGPLSINGIYTNLVDQQFSLYIPATYKGINVVLSSSGTLSFANDKIIFNPQVFRLGDLPLPKNYVLSLAKQRVSGEMLSILEDKLVLSTQVLPFNLKSLTLKGDKVVMTLQKISAESPVAPSGQAAAPAGQASGNASATDAKQEVLKRASRQLDAVKGAVKTAAEKDVITTIQGVVNKMVQNSAYNYKPEADAVKARYNALSADERSDIKDAILMNMDMTTLRQIKGTFGL
jgi:hypothetical protein